MMRQVVIIALFWLAAITRAVPLHSGDEQSIEEDLVVVDDEYSTYELDKQCAEIIAERFLTPNEAERVLATALDILRANIRQRRRSTPFDDVAGNLIRVLTNQIHTVDIAAAIRNLTSTSDDHRNDPDFIVVQSRNGPIAVTNATAQVIIRLVDQEHASVARIEKP